MPSAGSSDRLMMCCVRPKRTRTRRPEIHDFTRGEARGISVTSSRHPLQHRVAPHDDQSEPARRLIFGPFFPHGFFCFSSGDLFVSSSINFLKSSRPRIGSRSVSLAMCAASFQPPFTAFRSSSIARSAYSCFLSALLPLAMA